MERSKILEGIKEHLVGRGIEAEKVTEDAELIADLGLDSLDAVELALGMEEKFNIELPEEEMEGIETVGQTIDLVEQKLAVQT